MIFVSQMICIILVRVVVGDTMVLVLDVLVNFGELSVFGVLVDLDVLEGQMAAWFILQDVFVMRWCSLICSVYVTVTR